MLLDRWGGGDRAALDALMPVVYGELRRLASSHLRRERDDHTLEPTALVHEAWLRLVRQDQPTFEHRKQFFALAGQMMRRILVDHARAVHAAKRGGHQVRTDLRDDVARSVTPLENLLALDEALSQLAAVNARHAQVVELRHFAGLNLEEIAAMLDVSPATISRDQKVAEAWLAQVMAGRR